jgi:hypothetical protein
MHTYALTHLSDASLLADLAALVTKDREATAVLLAHLAEVDARRLFLPAACTSMHVYCTRVLHFSDDAAYKRIRAARAAYRFPALFEAIADGRLHLSGIGLLAAYFTDDNIDELIVAATHRSKADIEVLVASLAPKSDVPTRIRALPARAATEPTSALVPDPQLGAPTQLALSAEVANVGTDGAQLELGPIAAPSQLGDTAQVDRDAASLTNSQAAELAPGPVAMPAARPDAAAQQLIARQVGANAKPPTTKTKPLAPGRFVFQVTIDQATRDKLERAQALSRHRNPSGDLAVVFGMALDALNEKLEREKFAATSRARAKRARKENADPHYVPNNVKREVHARDGEQCTFVSDSGERCTARAFLELDHCTPVALGGKPTTDEMRILCRAHNQYEAERLLGADFVRAMRDAAKRSRCSDGPWDVRLAEFAMRAS